jgi:hypothetical protein
MWQAVRLRTENDVGEELRQFSGLDAKNFTGKIIP